MRTITTKATAKRCPLFLPLALLLAGCGGSTSSTTSNSIQPKLGTYGNNNSYVSLTLTSTGGTLSRGCETDVLTEPLTVDHRGNFDVTTNVGGSIPGPVVQIHLVGTVRGNTLTIAEAPTVRNNDAPVTYTLVLGQQSALFTGGCPV